MACNYWAKAGDHRHGISFTAPSLSTPINRQRIHPVPRDTYRDRCSNPGPPPPVRLPVILAPVRKDICRRNQWLPGEAATRAFLWYSPPMDPCYPVVVRGNGLLKPTGKSSHCYVVGPHYFWSGSHEKKWLNEGPQLRTGSYCSFDPTIMPL